MSEYVADEQYRVVRLRDGRRMSYAEYGDPNGFPVLNAHGGLACRVDVSAGAPIANECGVRLISPTDRASAGRTRIRAGPSLTGRATSPSCLTDSMLLDSP